MKDRIRLFIYSILQKSHRGIVGKFLSKIFTFYNYAINNVSNHDIDLNGEKRVIQKSFQYFGDSAVVFDVGANTGEWTLVASKVNANANFHCFEIAPNTAKILSKSLADTPQAIINTFGLSDNKGTLELRFFPNNNTGSSLYAIPWKEEYELVNVEVRKGDDYMIENSIEEIDFLKIDVEGADFDVIKGFEETLKNKKIKLIQFEYGRGAILSKKLLKDFYEFLEPYGFTIGRILMNSVNFKSYDFFRDENLLQGNFIAVHKDELGLIKSLN